VRRIAVSAGIAVAVAAGPLNAQAGPVTEVTPGLLVFATAAGNVAGWAGPDGAFVVGPVTAASTAVIQAELSRRTQSAVRYVIAMPSDSSRVEGDGGWGRLGAFVSTHETAWAAFGRANAPRAAFSEVLKFNLGTESPHAIHHPPGHSWSDVLVHFERSGVVYLGESLPGDGYPMIDSTQGGNLDSLIATLDPWTSGIMKFVPARGPVLRSADVRAFRDMLTTMRARFRDMRQAGRSVAQVVAANPAAEFDARFGHGRVSTEAFLREMYRGVATP
jgi:hypothetical protein